VWTEVSLENIRHNFREIRKITGDRIIMAVVKADGYGHGAVEVARALERECAGSFAPALRFAVATADEAEELISAGISTPVMSLGYTSPEDIGRLFSLGIIQAVYDLDTARIISEYGKAHGKRLKIHIKIDTGMSRLGFTAAENMERALDCVRRITALPCIETEGIFTHFATSEAEGDPFPAEQCGVFDELYKRLGEEGIHIPIRHASNSGGILNVPSAHYELVRPGLMLYGIFPGGGPAAGAELRPAMQLKARVAQVHDYINPVTVSYGRTFSSHAPIRTATVTIGYADGLHRALSNKMELIINGRRVKQIGNICMDMLVCDITGLDGVKPGDAVTVFGRDGGCEITCGEVAALAGTIPYEILCAPSRRVKRTVGS
jgi:alanine racemase